MWSPWQRVVRDLHWLLPSSHSPVHGYRALALALGQVRTPVHTSQASAAAAAHITLQSRCPRPTGLPHAAGFASYANPEPDWRQHTRTKFSIRPSLLSPLFSTYLLEVRKDHRRTTLAHLLEAHKLLSGEIEGLDPPQVERTAQYRVQQLHQLSQQLQALANRANITTCTKRSQMLAFYRLLEKQLHGSEEGGDAAGHGDGAAHATDAQLYYDLAHGRVNVWDAWQTQFVDRYKDAPSLPPLEAIFQEEYGRAQDESLHRSDNAFQTGQQETDKKRLESALPRMDVSGTVWAEGRRKTAVGQVLIKKGVGRITVNGLPYDEYFKDILTRQSFLLPLLSLPQLATSFDIEATVEKGGDSSQAQALRMALARGLRLFQSVVPPSSAPVLKYLGARDIRVKERKKIGRHGARSGFTYVRR